MEYTLILVILLVTVSIGVTAQERPQSTCTEPGNCTSLKCDWNLNGWELDLNDTINGRFPYLKTRHGTLQSNVTCPRKGEMHFLCFKYMIDKAEEYLAVKKDFLNGTYETLWNIPDFKTLSVWENGEILINSSQSFRIVIEGQKDSDSYFMGIKGITYGDFNCSLQELENPTVIMTTLISSSTQCTSTLSTQTFKASETYSTLSFPFSTDERKNDTTNRGSYNSNSSILPVIIGVVAAVIIFIAFAVGVYIFCSRKRARQDQTTDINIQDVKQSSNDENNRYPAAYPGIRLPKLNNEKPQKNNAPRIISSDDYTNTNFITKHTERPATTKGANLSLKLLNTAIASKSSFEVEGDYTAIDADDNPVAKDISMASSRTETEPDEDCVRIDKPDLRFAYSQVLTKGDNSRTMDSKAGDETLAGDTNDRSPQVSDTYSQVQEKFISMDIGSRTDDVMHAGDSRNVSDTYSLVQRNANSVAITNSAVEYNRIDFSNPKPSNKLDTYNTVDLPPTSAKSEGVEENEKACEPTHVNSSEDVYNTLDVEGDRSNSGRAYINDQKTGEVTQHTYAHMGQNFTTGNDTYAKVQNNKKERVFSSDYDHVN